MSKESFEWLLRRAAGRMAQGDLRGTEGYGEKLYRNFVPYFRSQRADIVRLLAHEVERVSGGHRTVREQAPGMPRFSEALLRVCVIDNTPKRLHSLRDGRVQQQMATDVRYCFFAGTDDLGFKLMRI